MPTFLLQYRYVPDIVRLRVPHRDAHLTFLEGLRADGAVIAGGATGDPVTGAAIVFAADDRDVVAGHVAADPYVRAGLVEQWWIDPWNVVVGTL